MAGRNTANIDWEIVDKLLSEFCDGTEVAAELGCHFDTLDRRGKQEGKWGEGAEHTDFAAYKQSKRATGAKRLRQIQLRSAQGHKDIPPSVSMQIWLGKQYLGQSDKKEIDQTVKAEKITLNIG